MSHSHFMQSKYKKIIEQPADKPKLRVNTEIYDSAIKQGTKPPLKINTDIFIPVDVIDAKELPKITKSDEERRIAKLKSNQKWREKNKKHIQGYNKGYYGKNMKKKE